MTTATQLAMRPNRRRLQVKAIVALVMDAIGKHIPDDGSSRKHATYDLIDALEKTGASFFTENDRREAGLLARDDHGWTREELAIMDAKLTMAMLSPLPTIIIPKVK